MKPSEYLKGNIARYIECDACGRITGNLWKAGKLCNNLVPTDGSRCQGILSQLREEEVEEIATDFKFERLSAKEYRGCDSAVSADIDLPYEFLVKAIGEPHRNGQGDFPDDSDKVSVCWGIRKPNTDSWVVIWDYKNRDIKPEEIESFSVDFSDESFFLGLMNYIDRQIQEEFGKILQRPANKEVVQALSEYTRHVK